MCWAQSCCASGGALQAGVILDEQLGPHPSPVPGGFPLGWETLVASGGDGQIGRGGSAPLRAMSAVGLLVLRAVAPWAASPPTAVELTPSTLLAFLGS